MSCPAKESAWILAENRPIYEPIYKLKESNCVLLQYELLRANINIHQFTTARPNHWKISEKKSWNHDDHGHLTAWFRVRCLVFRSFSHSFPMFWLHPDTAEMTNTEMSSFSLGRRQLELFNPGHPAGVGFTMTSGSWSKSSHILLGLYPILLSSIYELLLLLYIYIHIGDDEYLIYFWVYHIVTLAYEFRRLFLVETTRRSCCKHWHLDVAPVPIYTPCHNGRGFLLSLDLCALSTLSVWIGLTYSLD